MADFFCFVGVARGDDEAGEVGHGRDLEFFDGYAKKIGI